ncbi:MAG: nuclear transport factor 2 family protein [Saprospiraceae bacterium]|nr:nuclear transport factor 2 family protein [Saprospiraceae bacterium]
MPRLIHLLLFLALFFTACQSDSAKETPAKAPEPSLAEKLADQQLVAYNKRDLESFLTFFSDTVKVYNSLHEFGYQGTQKMYEVYEGWFGMTESMHCQIINRIATGNTVIDHERIEYTIDGKENAFESIAIYKVAGDKIAEVHFVRPEWK